MVGHDGDGGGDDDDDYLNATVYTRLARRSARTRTTRWTPTSSGKPPPQHLPPASPQHGVAKPAVDVLGDGAPNPRLRSHGGKPEVRIIAERWTDSTLADARGLSERLDAWRTVEHPPGCDLRKVDRTGRRLMGE